MENARLAKQDELHFTKNLSAKRYESPSTHYLELNYKHSLKSYECLSRLFVRYIVGIMHFLYVTNESTLMMSHQ